MTPRAMLHPDAFLSGVPYDELARLRDVAPVSVLELPDGTVAWNLVRHDDVASGLRALDLFSTPSVDVSVPTRATSAVERWAPQGMMVMAPPDHGAYRRRVSPLVRQDLLETYRHACRTSIDSVVGNAPRGDPFDVVEHVTWPAAAAAACTYLGVPPSAHEHFRRLSAQFMADTLPPAEMGPGAERSSHVRRLGVVSRSPARAVVDLLAESWGDGTWMRCEFARTASRWEIEDLGMQFVTAGTGGLRAVLTTTIELLAEHWDWVAEHRDAIIMAPSTLADELIRFASPLLRVRRILTRTTSIHGVRMSAGDTVLLWLVAANFDPHRFREPMAFDPHRSPNPHLGFGGGPHHCLGAPIARLQVEEFIRSVLTNWPNVTVGPAERFCTNVVNEVSSLVARVA